MIRKIILVIAAALLVSANAFAQGGQNTAKGFAADKTYEFGNLDHINLFNLNVNVVLPIGQTYQVSPALSYRFALTYSGNNWSAITNNYAVTQSDGSVHTEYRSYNVPVGSNFSGNAWNAGMGWRLSFGNLIPYAEDTCLCWTYVTPDGGRHDFLNGLHSPGSVTRNSSPAFTNDGSYLRMTRYNVGADWFRDVEFPDGTVHTFRDSDGQIIRMRDRFGNDVNITYGTMADGAPKWTIEDGFRTNTVEFKRITVTLAPGSVDTASYDVIKTIRLASFGVGHEADYVFTYGDSGDDSMDEISREVAQSQDEIAGPAVHVPLLHSITLPEDGTKFTMTYNEGDHGTHYTDSVFVGIPDPATCTSGICTYQDQFSGHLAALGLPTGGAIAWKYQDVKFPPESAGLGSPGPTGLGNFGGAHLAHAVGIVERVELDSAGTVLTRREYGSTYYKDGPTTASHTLITTAKTFNGPYATDQKHWGGSLFSTALSYYSVAPITYAGLGQVQGYYGLPFTSYTGTDPDPLGQVALIDPLTIADDSQPRFLSTKIYDAANHLQRYTYVGYDGDAPLMIAYDHSNRRQRSERTVFNDANGNYVASSWSVSSDFDGVGHYRTTINDGTFAGDNRRTSTTSYNKTDTDVGGTQTATGSYDPYATNPFLNFTLPATWILNTFTRQTDKASVTKPTATAPVEQTAVSLACFDSATGFLSRRRVLSGTTPASNDLVSRFTASSTGEVIKEESFGGDTQAVPVTPLCSATLPAIPAYAVTHDYANGSLKSSAYIASPSHPEVAKTIDPNFLSVDQDIDANTGLASASRDTAGVKTKYEFDRLGRLTEVKQVSAADAPISGWTSYTYAPRSGSTPAVVTVVQKAITGGTSLTQTKYEFDSIGRVSRELRLMPDATWSARETLYNNLGGKDKVSEAYTEGDTNKHYTVFGNYDPFGRARLVTAPDSTTTSFTFAGTSTTTRTVSIATGATETPVTTTEVYDRYGRLSSVTEPSGPSSAAAPVGANVTTKYAYDVGGRLTGVRMTGAEPGTPTQIRLFTYDGRGFLLSEFSPEGGTLSYASLTDPAKPSYDARGHATSRRTDGNTLLDLQYEYDAAERLIAVYGRNPIFTAGSTNQWTNTTFRTLKRFEYANTTGSPARGKVLTTSRYNYLPSFGVARVDETFGYNDAPGRRTDRTTTISYENDNGPLQTMRQFTQHTDYDDLDQPKSIGYPMCNDCTVPNIEVPERNLQPTYVAGRFATLPGFVTSTTYWPSGMLHQLEHSNGIRDTQDTDTTNGMSRPRSIKFDTYAACLAPSITVQPSSSTATSGSSVNLGVTATGTNLQYQWYEVVSGTATPIASAISATYTTPALTATKQYYVQLTSDCNTLKSTTAVITVTSCVPPTITSFVDGYNVPAGQTATLKVTATGTYPLTYAWYRGTAGDTSNPVGTNQPYYTTPAMNTTAFYWVKVSNTCNFVTSSAATVFVPLSAPANLMAARVGTSTTIRLTWNAVATATKYTVERKSLGSDFSQAAIVTSGTTWDDTGRTAGVTYVYRINATDAADVTSPYSNRDLATTASFVAPIAQTLITSSYFEDTRAALNLVRAANGLPALAWSEILPAGIPAPASPQKVWAAQVSMIRIKMDEALQSLGIAVTPYTDPDLTAGIKVKAQHITELEGRIQ